MVAVEKTSQIVDEIYRRNYLEEAPDIYSEDATLDEKVGALFFEGDLPSCLTNLLEIAVRLTGGYGYAVIPHWTGNDSGIIYGELNNGEYIAWECGPEAVEEENLYFLTTDGVSGAIRPEFPAVLIYLEGRKYPVELPVLVFNPKGYWFEKFSDLEEFLKESLCKA